jgi:HSP20 family molecular chaperone IbpA
VEQQEEGRDSRNDSDEYNDQQQELDDRPPTNMRSPPPSPRRRSFSLDEQVLDISHAKARLSQKGILDIIVPKLSDKQVTKKERVPISTDPPPEAAMSNNSNNLTILMDPPGTNADDLYIHYSHGRLEISGECGRGKLGNFKRTVPIDVKVWDPDDMKAFFYKDVLVVLVPARADHDQRDIDVRSYSTQSSFVRLSSRCSSEDEEDLELSGAVRPVQEDTPLLATWG